MYIGLLWIALECCRLVQYSQWLSTDLSRSFHLLVGSVQRSAANGSVSILPSRYGDRLGFGRSHSALFAWPVTLGTCVQLCWPQDDVTPNN